MGKVVDEALVRVDDLVRNALPSTWGHITIAVQDYTLGRGEMGVVTNMMRQDAIHLLRHMANDLESREASVPVGELEAAPRIKAGDLVDCEVCEEKHVIESRMSSVRKTTGSEDVIGTLEFLFYRCGENVYMAGLGGKSVLGSR